MTQNSINAKKSNSIDSVATRTELQFIAIFRPKFFEDQIFTYQVFVGHFLYLWNYTAISIINAQADKPTDWTF